jgi:hypothetical protein
LTYSPAAGTVLGPGTQTLTVTAAATTDYNAATASVSLNVLSQFLELLDATAKRALTVSGDGSVKIPGPVAVDSTSSTAILASGNAQVSGTSIQVVGGYQKSGNSSINPTPATGSPHFADPLASLSGPSTTGLTNYGSVKVSGNNTQTLQPGIYSAISVSGNASVTLSAGLYLIEGGGFTVTGNASVSGTGVTIYNANSNYPNPGGNTGGITLSGNGTFNLSAASTAVNGAYPGIVIFQSRANTRALTISGNAGAGLSGTVYAANAPVVASGNASFQVALIADALNVSGNVHLTQMAAGTDGAGDSGTLANTLLAGNLEVYVNDPAGYFTTNELGRIQDAITAWDALLAPYNVQIDLVTDPSQANLILDDSATSVCGGSADGVLGCYNPDATEIAMLQGWNWYDGSDPTQIGAGQYDFQTVVTHELGHALGLGGSTDPNSPMNETLAAGTVRRSMTVADLNLTSPPDGADPELAAPRPAKSGVPVTPIVLPEVHATPATVEFTAPHSAGTLVIVRFVEVPTKAVPAPVSQSGWTPASANLARVTVTPAGGTKPLFVVMVPSSRTGGVAEDSGSNHDVPSSAEPSGEWLDRLFQEESITPDEQTALPLRGPDHDRVDRLVTVLANSWNAAPNWPDACTSEEVAILAGVENRGFQDEFSPLSPQLDLEGLVLTLLGAYGLTQSEVAESRHST